MGKITVVKTFALPKHIYPLTVLNNPPVDILKKIKLEIFSFIWDSFCIGFVALRPKSTSMVIAGVSSPNHTFSWASLNKQLTSTSCTYFRL